MTGFSEFGIGTGSSNTLPATLTIFTGIHSNNVNMLNWTTASEQNVKGFELQRSIDGNDFSTITFVKSKATSGNSTTRLSYSFADSKAVASNNYYRLNQVDNDGKVTVNNIVLIKGLQRAALTMAAIYPVPASRQIRLIIEGGAQERASISIFDMNGRKLMQQSRLTAAGSNSFTLDISRLPAGNYSLHIIQPDGTAITKKFIKQ